MRQEDTKSLVDHTLKYLTKFWLKPTRHDVRKKYEIRISKSETISKSEYPPAMHYQR